MTQDANDDRGRTVVIDVSGARAYERAKERIQDETNGVDPDRVRSVSARIEIGPVPDDEAPADGPSDDADADTTQSSGSGGRTPYARYGEEDRELAPVSQGSQHEALSLLAEADAFDRESAVTSHDLKPHVEHQAESSVSSTLGKLYLKRAAEREPVEGGNGLQRYWISKYGADQLEDLGPFREDAEIGSFVDE